MNRRLLKEYIYGQINPTSNTLYVFDDPDWKYSSRTFTHSVCNELNDVLNSTSEHYIGRLQNQWFQQLIDGATAIGSACYEVDVLPLSDDPDEAWEIAENIVLRNFTYNLFGVISYEDVRQGSIEAVRELYPGNERILKTVIDSWHNLGVGSSYDYYTGTLIPTHTIPAGETVNWSGNRRVSGIIKVDGTLILNDANISFTNENSGIIIEKGGKVQITNSSHLLPHVSCNNSSAWGGIQVLGDPEIPHPTTYNFNNNYPDWGVLEIDNSIIDRAVLGVRASQITSLNNNLNGNINNNVIDGDFGGGIIRIENTTFKSCKKGIHIAASNQSSGVGNLNRISNCTFKFQEQIPDLNATGISILYGFPLDYSNLDCGIYLNGAQNFNISNTSFIAAGNLDYETTGVHCSNCSGIIGKDVANSHDYKNTFTNLYKGISIFEFSSGITLNVFHNDFVMSSKE